MKKTKHIEEEQSETKKAKKKQFVGNLSFPITSNRKYGKSPHVTKFL